MVRKRGLPDWAYYAFAVCVSLLTIPMYRYMFAAHATDGHALPERVVASEQVTYAQSRPADLSTASDMKPLLPGELCEAGYVVLKNGNAYTQGIGPDGHPARCVGGFVIVSRR